MDYYVDSVGGSDSNDGQRPEAAWATLWRAFYDNASGKHQSYQGRDTLHLKRGCVWTETLYLNSVASGGSVTVKPYGDGAPPVINGGNNSAITNSTNVVAVMNVQGEPDPRNVTRSIRLPAGRVLKAVDIGATPGASGTVTFASDGESQTISLSATAQYRKKLTWNKPPAGGEVSITISVSPDTSADGIALDHFVIGDPSDHERKNDRTIDFREVARCPEQGAGEPLNGTHYSGGSSDPDDGIDFGTDQWIGRTVWDGCCGLTGADSFYPVSNWHLIGLELRTNQRATEGHDHASEVHGPEIDTYGVLLVASSDSPCDGLLVQDCLVRGVSRTGIYLETAGVVTSPAFTSPQIIGCEVYDADQGIVLTAHGAFHGFDQALISKCKTHDTEYCGILVGGADLSVVSECEAYKTDLAPLPSNGCEAVGIMLGNCIDSRIEYCLSHDNNTPGHFGDGFDIMVSSGCIMQYNLSWNNGWVGLLISADNTCRYNISWNDSMDPNPVHDIPAALMIELAPAPWNTNTKVYNNTVVTFAPTTPPLFGYGPTHLVANNVFVVLGDHDAPLAVWDTLANAQGNTFRNNIYWRDTGVGSVRFRFNDDQKDPTYMTDFETWVRTVRGENERNQDPELVNSHQPPTPAGGGDCHPASASSPCYRAGADLSREGIEVGRVDYYGRELPSPGGKTLPDIGAACSGHMDTGPLRTP